MPKKKGHEAERRSFQELGMPWFGAQHGIDNFEDVVDLREVQSIRCSYVYMGNHSGLEYPWDYKVGFWLKGKQEPFEMRLNADGYVALLDALVELSISQKV